MNAHDLLQAFSEIDSAYLREAQRRAESPDYEYASFSQEREITMKHTLKHIIAGMTAVAATCAVVIGTSVYMDRNAGYTVQSSDYPVELVSGTDASSATEANSTDLSSAEETTPPDVDAVVLPLSDALPDLVPKQHVLFGEYEWRVLDVQDGRALLLTEYGIDCRPYNDELTEVTWETCSLRKWLNGDFYNSFSEEDHARILTVTNENPDIYIDGVENGGYSVEAGNDTEDKFFCLSLDEANAYFCSNDEEDMLCKPTQTAIDKDVYAENGYCYWWLRTPGYDNKCVGVGTAGIYTTWDPPTHTMTLCAGFGNDRTDIAIRPAVWVQIEQ